MKMKIDVLEGWGGYIALFLLGVVLHIFLPKITLKTVIPFVSAFLVVCGLALVAAPAHILVSLGVIVPWY